MKTSAQILRKLGVYGFDDLELVILAALVSEDPMLLIGKAGTGKTYLLNSISESLNLDHRHYNASFISFDDLIGFPFPDAEGKAVSFLKTPATIWDAESVLIDEISRCKPETQNKFFSIIHEKKIQGIPLGKLKYRWAAMNPIVSVNGNSDDFYEGSVSLDQALADRFAFIITVPDWAELSREEQELVIYPAGEGSISANLSELNELLADLKPRFLKAIEKPDAHTISYCRVISTLLGDAGYRISPRRARQLARNFTALFLVAMKMGHSLDNEDTGRLFSLGLNWSLPQRAWKGGDPDPVLHAAHAECMRMIGERDMKGRWLSEFLMVPSIKDKVAMLFGPGADKETKSLGVLQFLHRESIARAGVFAFSSQPALEALDILDEEALKALTGVALKIMEVSGELSWQENVSSHMSLHPQWSSCLHFLSSMPDDDTLRTRRARQFFLYLVLNKVTDLEHGYLEKEMNDCFSFVQNYLQTLSPENLSENVR